jgi:hypothetical protein
MCTPNCQRCRETSDLPLAMPVKMGAEWVRTVCPAVPKREPRADTIQSCAFVEHE